MKKRSLILPFVLSVSVVPMFYTIGCNNQQEDSIEIVGNDVIICNNSYTYTIKTTGSVSKDVVWSVEDPNNTGVTISADGVVTTQNITGVFNILAKSKSDIIAYKTITIKEGVESVRIEYRALAFYSSRSYDIWAKVKVNDESIDSSVTWESENPNVAEVVDNHLYCKKNGTVVISAISNADNSKSDKLLVNISSPIKNIDLGDTVILLFNNPYYFQATVNYEDAPSDNDVYWSMEDPDNTGSQLNAKTGEFVAGTRQGLVHLTATSNKDNTISSTVEVVIRDPLEGASLLGDSAVYIGTTSSQFTIINDDGFTGNYQWELIDSNNIGVGWDEKNHWITTGPNTVTGVVTVKVRPDTPTQEVFQKDVLVVDRKDCFKYNFQLDAHTATITGIDLEKDPIAKSIYSCFLPTKTKDETGNEYDVVDIKDHAFFYANNECRKIFIPNTIKSVGVEAFYGSSCHHLDFQDNSSLTHIDNFAFANTMIETVTFPDIHGDSASFSFGKGIFKECSNLESFVFKEANDGIKEIPEEILVDCFNLKNLYLPRQITSIKPNAFKGCSKLSEIIFGGTRREFEAVTKGEGWCAGIAAKVVHCDDGDWIIR